MTTHCVHVSCSNRSFVIQQIPSSNLFMVVVDSSCVCESVAPITMAPIEIRYILLGIGPAMSAEACKAINSQDYWGRNIREGNMISFPLVERKINCQGSLVPTLVLLQSKGKQHFGNMP